MFCMHEYKFLDTNVVWSLSKSGKSAMFRQHNAAYIQINLKALKREKWLNGTYVPEITAIRDGIIGLFVKL